MRSATYQTATDRVVDLSEYVTPHVYEARFVVQWNLKGNRRHSNAVIYC